MSDPVQAKETSQPGAPFKPAFRLEWVQKLHIWILRHGIYDESTSLKNFRKSQLAALVLLAPALLSITGCKPPLPPSKPLSELTPQEQQGHQVFAARCAGCHYANNENPLHGPGLQGLYKKKYLPSGAAANDNRIEAVIERGRNMMPAFGNTMDDEQLADLMAYLHTL